MPKPRPSVDQLQAHVEGLELVRRIRLGWNPSAYLHQERNLQIHLRLGFWPRIFDFHNDKNCGVLCQITLIRLH